MNRIDELIQVVTYRFGDDAGLQRQIAQELHDHVEDSMQAARAEGMDDAQAEEAAIVAFGDPDEVAGKLWQANLRRLRHRAVVKWGALWLLMLIGVILADWWWRTYAWGPTPWGKSAYLVAVGMIVLISLPFLPKTAIFGWRYLLWLPAAFCRSAQVAFHNPWIWAPALVVYAVNATVDLVQRWHFLVTTSQNKGVVLFHAGEYIWKGLFSRLHMVRPETPSGLAWVLLYIAYLVFAARMGNWLQSGSGLDARRARRWHVAFLVGACAGICITVYMFFQMWVFWHQQQTSGGLVRPLMLVYLATAPFLALLTALYLNVVLRAVRGQSKSLAEVLKSAFVIIWPLLWFTIILFSISFLQYAFVLARQLWPQPVARLWEQQQIVTDSILLLTAFIPVIILSEQCGLGSAFARFGRFLWRHFWRYVAFVVLGALLLALPELLAEAAFGRSEVGMTTTLLGVQFALSAARFALQLVLTVMCFEFYLAKAGTASPIEPCER